MKDDRLKSFLVIFLGFLPIIGAFNIGAYGDFQKCQN
jgi:nitrate reductase NapE component